MANCVVPQMHRLICTRGLIWKTNARAGSAVPCTMRRKTAIFVFQINPSACYLPLPFSYLRPSRHCPRSFCEPFPPVHQHAVDAYRPLVDIHLPHPHIPGQVFDCEISEIATLFVFSPAPWLSIHQTADPHSERVQFDTINNDTSESAQNNCSPPPLHLIYFSDYIINYNYTSWTNPTRFSWQFLPTFTYTLHLILKL